MKYKIIVAALLGRVGAFGVARTANEAEDTSSLGLLIKGAGVEASDVNWRIVAGLSPAQAVEVALAQKNNDAKNTTKKNKISKEKK